MISGGFGSKRFWPKRGIIPAFVLRDWGKPSVRIADIPAEIRTEKLPNTTSQEHYGCLNPSVTLTIV
jgi:hypothetical protein